MIHFFPASPPSASAHSLVADDDFAVLGFAENLEAFPQHVLGHARRQVVDVKHLAVVLATGKPWQQSGQTTIRTTRENFGAIPTDRALLLRRRRRVLQSVPGVGNRRV